MNLPYLPRSTNQRFIAFGLLFLSLPIHADTTIIHGVRVSAQSWIAQTVVALVAKGPRGTELCTASIVADDLAVTAAHCVKSEDGNDSRTSLSLLFSIDAHTTDFSLLRTIDRVEVPREWTPNGEADRDTSDMAVVHFNGGLPEGYTHSDLLPFDYELKKGQRVTLAGYGISDAHSGEGAGILRQVEVSLLNPSYSPSEVEFDQSHGGGACHGDSGGPAYLIIDDQPYFFGVTSRGGGNCDESVIYTKLSAYQNWFTKAVAALRH